MYLNRLAYYICKQPRILNTYRFRETTDNFTQLKDVIIT